MNRISVVNDVKVTSISTSATLIVGDSVKITARSRALAVQRQVAVFFRKEGEFADYPLFTKEIPQPSISERVHMRVVQESPYIKVGHVKVLGVASASTFQIGSTRFIDLEARLKHFRQFVTSIPPINREEIVFESYVHPVKPANATAKPSRIW
jgi:spore germination protein PE